MYSLDAFSIEFVMCLTALSSEGKLEMEKLVSFSSMCLVNSDQFASL